MILAAVFALFLCTQIVASEEHDTPYERVLKSGFSPHTRVVVSGTVKPKPKRFDINFVQNTRSCYFHFNPRFIEKKIVLNTMRDGYWDKNHQTIKWQPLKPGERFKVEFQCEEDYFNVFWNGKFLVKYNARLHPLHNIRSIEVHGDVTVEKISVSSM